MKSTDWMKHEQKVTVSTGHDKLIDFALLKQYIACTTQMSKYTLQINPVYLLKLCRPSDLQ